MKFSKIIFAIATISIIAFSSCKEGGNKSEPIEGHGHEHDTNGNHIQEEKVEQEEFTVKKDSLQIKVDTYKHDNSEEHHNH